jgi:integrase
VSRSNFLLKKHLSLEEGVMITRNLTNLAVDLKVAASTQNQALSEQRCRGDRGQRRIHLCPHAPLLLGPSAPWLLYGSGLHFMEAVRLRVKDLDFTFLLIRCISAKSSCEMAKV